MDVNTEAAVLIEGAVEVLEKDGWCQGISENQLGQRCLSGAVVRAFNVATSSHYMPPELEKATYRALNEACQEIEHVECEGAQSGQCITCWNDADGRTFSQVLDAAKNAAKNLRNSAKPE